MRRAMLLALGFTLLAGCGKSAPTQRVGERYAWTVPHVLRIADVSDPDHLNPYLSEMDVSYDLASLIYSYLVIADDRGRLIGDLATGVPTLANGGISRDGKTYVYRLHRGVRWHDGSAFTARDVVASWRAVMNPRNDTFENEGYDRVASIDAPDPYTVVVHLRERYPPFVSRFFAPLQEGGKPILPARVLAREQSFNAGELSVRPDGTGPFRFVAWERGDKIELVRNDDYFKGRPKIERIEFDFIPSNSTIATMLQTHRIDLIVAPQASLIDQYRAVDGIVVSTAAWNSQGSMILNASKPALHDLAVRRAIAAAVPYETILRDVARNLFEPARNSSPPTAIGYVPLGPRTFDPARANALLDADGWRRGSDGIRRRGGQRLALTVDTIAGLTNFERIALLLQSSFRSVGIDVTIKPYPYRTIFAIPNGPIYGGGYDVGLYADTLNWDPDVYNFLACDRFYPRGQNIFRFCDPGLDALERAGLQTDDPAERAAIYGQAGRVIWSTVPYVPLYDARRLIVRSADLHGYSPNPTSTPWWNSWQWDI